MQSHPQVSFSDNRWVSTLKDTCTMVSRAICIMRSSLKPDVFNVLVIFPPRYLFPQQVTAVFTLQIGGNLAICPPGLFVLYLSTLCNEAIKGKELLEEGINALINPNADAARSISNSSDDTENAGASPIIWKALYIQQLIEGHCDTIYPAPMPDGRLDYNNMLEATKQLFETLYPNEKFFRDAPSENSDDDDADSDSKLQS